SRIRPLAAGRRLIASSRATASASKGSQPRPHTASDGYATTPPERSRVAAWGMSSSGTMAHCRWAMGIARGAPLGGRGGLAGGSLLRGGLLRRLGCGLLGGLFRGFLRRLLRGRAGGLLRRCLAHGLLRRRGAVAGRRLPGGEAAAALLLRRGCEQRQAFLQRQVGGLALLGDAGVLAAV